MDERDEKILDLMQGNARLSYSELGEALGISRVAAKKRVLKLEREGIIRGYNTCIYREGEVTLFIDIVTLPGRFESVLDYLSFRTAFVRQIFTTTKEDHIHLVAVSESVRDLNYLVKMIRKNCGDDIAELYCHAAKEVIKDVYGSVRPQKRLSDQGGYHEKRSVSDSKKGNGESSGS